MPRFLPDLIRRPEPTAPLTPADGSAAPRGGGNPGACFLAYNRVRRARIDRQIGERGSEALRMLPLLLHVNQTGLPGFVEGEACPCGVADYSPANFDLALARRLFPESSVRRVGILQPAVDLVAVMGSAGTIGFSADSDLDVWVCHNDSVRGQGLRLYEQKVAAIERWLNQHSGLEIHLFLQATAKIRGNDFGETGVEGCGSAMGTLLKEEFYRTSVVLGGKPPFWWLIPPDVGPDEYRTWLAELRADPTIDAKSYVDLGALARVPVGESFGAAIWQIVKGWKSPFKSALKMGLLEKAVRAGSEVPLLCEVLKQRVLAGEEPDPYRLLFDEVLAHYQGDGDGSTQDLLARCFYLKTGIRLDPDQLGAKPGDTSDAAVLSRYALAWGWGPRRVRHLNQFERWKFEWIQSMAEEVDRFFLRTYRRIRSTLEASGEAQRITPRDLTILGRRLQAIYRRAPHKVETLHLVTRGVEEAALSLYQETLPDGETPWRIYRGRVTPFNVDEKEADLLRMSDDCIELLVWAAQNRLLGLRTRLFCRGLEREVPAAELESLGGLLVSFLGRGQDEGPPLEHLLGSPRPTRLVVIPNLGLGEDRMREVGAVSVTTWGETYYQCWSGADVFQAFSEQALVPFLLQAEDLAAISVFAPPRKVGAYHGLHRQLQQELPALVEFLGGGEFPEGVRKRFLGPAAEGFFLLERLAARDVRFRSFPDRDGLLRDLSGVGPYHRVETRIEQHGGDLSILRAMVETSAAGVIDIFLLREPDGDALFVVDEIGNLVHFPHRTEEEPYALAKLLVFLEGVMPDLAAQPEGPLAGRSLREAIRIHTLALEATCRATDVTHDMLSRVRALALQPRGLVIEKTNGDAGETGFRITWGKETIRSGEVGSPLAEVRERIRAERRSGVHYDAFVTRLFLDDGFERDYCGAFATTGHYLFYKKAIEARLS